MNIFERLIRDKIFREMPSSSVGRLLNQNQHGFLSGKSYNTQMIVFSDSLAFSLDDNMQTDVVYVDFTKAFDSVNHDIITYKLKN